MRAIMIQAGERLLVDCPSDRLAGLLSEACPNAWRPVGHRGADIEVRIRRDRGPFDVTGWEPVTRGVFRRSGTVVLTNACGSGFDLRVHTDDRMYVEAHWCPPNRERLASVALRARFHLLARAVLVQYPALWWAGLRGRVPLHAGALTSRSANGTAMVPLLAGPGGIGRSTLLLAALHQHGHACADNLCVGDGDRVWGVVEPVRVAGGTGRRMAFGRREQPLPRRTDVLRPDRLVLLRRENTSSPVVRPIAPERAAHLLVAGTYLAGELRRYWPFAATLALGTGIGPVHPPLAEVAARLTETLPAWEIVLGDRPTLGLAELLDDCVETAVAA